MSTLDGPRPVSRGITIINSNPTNLTYTNSLIGGKCSIALFRTLRLTNNILVCNVPRFHLPGMVIRRRVTGLHTLNIRIRAGVIVNGILSVSRLVSRNNFRTIFVNANTNLPHFVNVPNRGLGKMCSTGRCLAHMGLVGTCQRSGSAPVRHTHEMTIINNNGITVSTTHYTVHLNTSRISVICQHSVRRLPTQTRRIRRTGRRNVRFHLLAGPVRVQNSSGHYMANLHYMRVRLNRPSTANHHHPLRGTSDTFLLRASYIVVTVNASPGPLVGSAARKLRARH